MKALWLIGVCCVLLLPQITHAGVYFVNGVEAVVDMDTSISTSDRLDIYGTLLDPVSGNVISGYLDAVVNGERHTIISPTGYTVLGHTQFGPFSNSGDYTVEFFAGRVQAVTKIALNYSALVTNGGAAITVVDTNGEPIDISAADTYGDVDVPAGRYFVSHYSAPGCASPLSLSVTPALHAVFNVNAGSTYTVQLSCY